MNKLYDRFDRFCYRHSNWGIPNLMLVVVIGNIAVFFLSLIDPSNTIVRFLMYSSNSISNGQIWRMLTYIFIPLSTNISDIIWVAISLYFYYFIGSTLERQWGTLRLNIFYFSGVLLTSIACLLLGSYASVTYVNLSLFLAFATMYPDTRVLLFFFIPVKMKWLAIAELVLSAYTVIFMADLLPLFALLNYVIYFLPNIINLLSSLSRRLFGQGAAYKRNVRRAQKPNSGWTNKYKSKDGKAPYRHKCTVCGKTDTEYPELDFRYCSRCNGYYCYCQEHINTHVHIQ